VRGWKAAGFLLDLTLLAASLVTDGPVSDGVRTVALVVVVMVGGAVVFLVVCLAVAVLQQRQPPYEL
jgi:hypothetical protein